MSVWNPEAMLDPHKRQSKISRLADVNCKEKTCMSLATIMSTPRGGVDCMYTGREGTYAHAHRTYGTPFRLASRRHNWCRMSFLYSAYE
jgi:hypothetical protein